MTVCSESNPGNGSARGADEAADFVVASLPRSLMQGVVGFMLYMNYIYQNLKRLMEAFFLWPFGMLGFYNVSFMSLGRGSTGPVFYLSGSHHFVKLRPLDFCATKRMLPSLVCLLWD